MQEIRLRLGDSFELLRVMDDDSVGAVCTDPPYGLEFMGKDWDRLQGYTADINFKGFVLPRQRKRNVKCPDCGKYIYDHPGRACTCGGVERLQHHSMQAWHLQWLQEVFRVLKPGGIIKVFGATRTFHRLAAAMEEAGFVDLDLEAWMYGSGFPKSLNISKALDKKHGRLNSSVVQIKKELIRLFKESGKSSKEIDAECGFRACNYLSYPEEGKRPDPWFNVLPSWDKWLIIKHVLGIEGDDTRELEEQLDGWFKEAEREVVGQRKVIPGVAFTSEGPDQLDITLPATPEAERYEGYGTALKPAWEPFVIGRKP